MRERREGARPRLWSRWSLRLRLTLVAAGLFAVALALGATVLSMVVSDGRVAALDEVLRGSATTVARLAESDQLPDVLPATEPGEVAQLLDADGLVLATSASGSRTLAVVPASVLAEAEAEREVAGRGEDGAAAGDPGSPGEVEPVVLTTDRSAYAGGLVRTAVVPVEWQGRQAWAVSVLPLREVEGVVSALRVSLGAVVPLLSLTLGALVWALLGRALRPVEELRRGAEAVTARGGPGSLPVPAAGAELGDLARTLNAMLDRLEASAERQRAFVADAAHELRSPVAALRVSVDIAQQHPDAYTSAELAADLGGEVQRLDRLVDDLLVLARLGATTTARETVDLRDLAEDVVAGSVVAAQASAASRPAGTGLPRVEVRGAGTAATDRTAAGRVVRNLVDNALRHSASRVLVEVRDGRVVVEDDGPGIAAADRERVFERFTRLEDGRQRDAGGSGLGLSIAREVARDLGGDVCLTAAEPRGTRATLTLPPAPPL
ncbi:signal transduction histidine kinase [Sanguibacter keddieii DSM 10542]|uniref:histidine kinase n=1 Tax=Sanguibacter keddieii (strain ATCC 51767 / DSM 10542 / NCFB 3025 / ST-74) TaxID=446469 RepID=D1BIV0_SANKS|nr:signal transduction histidine kinase [Sanguibacter keddieii DSM 10542]